MVLNKKAIHRLSKDVKYIIKNPLDKENIFYKHDEENIAFGYVLIIGNIDTPYAYGYYFFKFIYPDDYPYSPPDVKFLSNDGYIRYNPNLYTNGKVCLSILNTWYGDGWTSCCTLHSVLLNLMTIFNENPLLNEPGVKETDLNIPRYNLLLSYKNVDFSIIRQYNTIIDLDKDNKLIKNNKDNKKTEYEKIILLFKDIFIENLKNNYSYIKKFIEESKDIYNNSNNITITISTYALNIKPNFDLVMDNFNKIII